MSRLAVGIALVAVLGSLTAYGQQPEITLRRADEFFEMTGPARANYTAGFVEGIFAAVFLTKEGPYRVSPSLLPTAQLLVCTRGMSPEQQAAIVEKYLKDHPEMWHRTLALSTWEAFAGVCSSLPSLLPAKD